MNCAAKIRRAGKGDVAYAAVDNGRWTCGAIMVDLGKKKKKKKNSGGWFIVAGWREGFPETNSPIRGKIRPHQQFDQRTLAAKTRLSSRPHPTPYALAK